MRGIQGNSRNAATWEADPARNELPVPSRRDALSSLLNGLLNGGPAPLLLTGETGSGKSWLCRKLLSQLPARWRSLVIEITEAMEPAEFLAMLADGLGLEIAAGMANSRIGLRRALCDEARDGRSWLLILENPHTASSAVRAELMALIHSMEAGESFASTLLVGPTSLARQFGGIQWNALASRLAVHSHLLPLDLEECEDLVRQYRLSDSIDAEAVERLQRDMAGNPRRIVRYLAARGSVPRPELGSSRQTHASRSINRPVGQERSREATISVPTQGTGKALTADRTLSVPADVVIQPTASLSAPELIPSRPPLRVEEGLVEVGWAGNLEAECPADPEEVQNALRPAIQDAAEPEAAPLGEEMIEDHYAALQAWNEWAMNRGRSTESISEPAPTEDFPPAEDVSESSTNAEDSEPEDQQGKLGRVGLRAEAQHEHAPYSQLFSKMRQSN